MDVIKIEYNIVSLVFINVYIFLICKWHLYIICIEVPILLWFIAPDTFNQPWHSKNEWEKTNTLDKLFKSSTEFSLINATRIWTFYSASSGYRGCWVSCSDSTQSVIPPLVLTPTTSSKSLFISVHINISWPYLH